MRQEATCLVGEGSPSCELVFVSTKGSPYARFRRALDTGNLTLIRGAAAELPQVPLDDALRICLLLRHKEPASYGRAAVRWIARFALERKSATLGDLRIAAEAFEELPTDPEWAVGVLSELCH
jgi:hypothetical protein